MTTTITVSGFLSRDPETRVTPSGHKVTSLSIPTTSGKDRETTWWRASFWGDKYEKMMPYLKKGSCLIITGSLTRPPSTYHKDGKTMINSLEISADMIQFAPGKKDDSSAQKDNSSAQNKTTSQSYIDSDGFDDSDLPF